MLPYVCGIPRVQENRVGGIETKLRGVLLIGDNGKCNGVVWICKDRKRKPIQTLEML